MRVCGCLSVCPSSVPLLAISGEGRFQSSGREWDGRDQRKTDAGTEPTGKGSSRQRQGVRVSGCQGHPRTVGWSRCSPGPGPGPGITPGARCGPPPPFVGLFPLAGLLSPGRLGVLFRGCCLGRESGACPSLDSGGLRLCQGRRASSGGEARLRVSWPLSGKRRSSRVGSVDFCCSCCCNSS